MCMHCLLSATGFARCLSSILYPLSSLSKINSRQPILIQSIPEDGDGVEHLAAALEELVVGEFRIEENFFQLFHGVAGVLGLHPVVPGKESKPELGMPGLLDPQEAILEFLPETGRRPVLDGKARALGDLRIIAAI